MMPATITATIRTVTNSLRFLRLPDLGRFGVECLSISIGRGKSLVRRITGARKPAFIGVTNWFQRQFPAFRPGFNHFRRRLKRLRRVPARFRRISKRLRRGRRVFVPCRRPVVLGRRVSGIRRSGLILRRKRSGMGRPPWGTCRKMSRPRPDDSGASRD